MSDPIDDLIKIFRQLPGVGPKMAERFVYFILRRDHLWTDNLTRAITELKNNIYCCSVCGDFTSRNPCTICGDEMRQKDIVCVVETPASLKAIEKTKKYPGRYFILGASISPLDGIGPKQLAIERLLDYLHRNQIKEVIIAANTTSAGEITTTFLFEQIKNKFPNIRITHLAYGLPMGGELEYADEVTISRALEGRLEISKIK
jgi:recombination protein RecR